MWSLPRYAINQTFFFLCCIIQLCICYHFFNLVFLTHSDTGDVCCFICFVLHFCKRATPGIDSNTLNPLSFMKLKKGHSLAMKVKDGKINLHKIFYTDWFLSITVNANKQYYITSNILQRQKDSIVNHILCINTVVVVHVKPLSSGSGKHSCYSENSHRHTAQQQFNKKN